MKHFKQTLRFGSVPAALLVAGTANAALSTAVTDTISTGVTDAATLGGLILALVVGIAIYRHVRGAK